MNDCNNINNNNNIIFTNIIKIIRYLFITEIKL